MFNVIVDWFNANKEFLLSFDFLSFVVFIVFLTGYLIMSRKDLDIQMILGFKGKKKSLPVVYMALYRKQWGVNFINKFAEKFKKPIKVFGGASIVIGILGMVAVVAMLIYMLVLLIKEPLAKGTAALVLPFTNIPGIGYLSFWYWIICLTVVVIIHEFAHAIVARAHDIKIKNTGIGVFGAIIPLLPVAFVEPDEKAMAEKSDYIRHSVFAAGPSINIIAAILTLGLIFLFGLFVMSPFAVNNSDQGAFTFQVDEDNLSLPSVQGGLKDNMIVTSFNGEKVESFSDVNLTIISPGEEIVIGGYLDEDYDNYVEYSVVTTTHPDNSSRPFIGITDIVNTYKYKHEKARESMKMIMWIYYLLVWMHVLQLGIGLMNLVPLGITDGGQMAILAFKRWINNEKIEKIVMTIIILFFASILIGSLVLNYAGGLIAKLFNL